MLAKWLTRLENVRIAKTERERKAIFALRYQVYVQELGKKNAHNADHIKGLIKDPEDDEPDVILLYTGSLPEITGSLRLNLWEKGKVPKEIHERFSLDLFPEIEKRKVCEAGRLMVRSNLRGKLILPSLARACYQKVCEEHDVDFAFIYCSPGLVRVYRRLGFRPYAGRLITTLDGIRVPLLMIPSDLRYFREVNSPLTPLVKEIFGYGKRKTLNIKPYLHLLEADAAYYQVDAQTVWTSLQNEFLDSNMEDSTFLQDLTPQDIKLLSSKGFILEVDAGQTVTRAQLVEKEVFLIMEGSFEALVGKKRLAVLNKGDVFGEEAFFLESGKRTSTIKSMTPGKVIVLRRRFIKEIAKQNPLLESSILFNLGRVMAKRLAEMISSIDSPDDFSQKDSQKKIA